MWNSKKKITIIFQGGIYKSADDYFNTMQSLWNAMTFGDGNAALSPKCRFKKMDKDCGEVLWPLDEKSSAAQNVRCRSIITGGNKVLNLTYTLTIWIPNTFDFPDTFCPVFKWCDLVIWQTIWIPDISDY